jgi:hypothetical protein
MTAPVLVERAPESASGPPAPSTRPSSNCPAATRCCVAAFSASHPDSQCVDPRYSISCDLRREDYTACAATAPDVFFTVRVYGTSPLHEPRLVRKFSSHELQTHRSAPHGTGCGQIVAQLRC